MITETPTLKLGFSGYADLSYFTAKVPDYPTQPSRHITEHVETIYASSMRRGNSHNGDIFEVCFLDAMSKFSFQGARIDISKIEAHTDVQPPKNAEADFWVNPQAPKTIGASPIMLMLKTSLRERYKQEDRDAMIAKQTKVPAPTTIGVVLAEDNRLIGGMTAKGLEKEKNRLHRTVQRCAGIDELLSAYDKDAMLRLFRAIAAC
jgi:hypothetical protein